MINFVWHCGASSLVDESYITWDVIASSVVDAHAKAYKYLNESLILDVGTLDINMDTTQLAMNFANIACEDTDSFEPSETYIKAIDDIREKYPEVYMDMEMIVSNANL